MTRKQLSTGEEAVILSKAKDLRRTQTRSFAALRMTRVKPGQFSLRRSYAQDREVSICPGRSEGVVYARCCKLHCYSKCRRRRLVRAVHGPIPPQAVLGPAFTPGRWDMRELPWRPVHGPSPVSWLQPNSLGSSRTPRTPVNGRNRSSVNWFDCLAPYHPASMPCPYPHFVLSREGT